MSSLPIAPRLSSSLKKTFTAAALALVAAGLCAAPAAMAASKKASTKVAKKSTKKKVKAAAEPKVEQDDGPSEADSGDTISTDYHCELGNVLTIMQHDGDDSHIAMRWKNRVHRLEKVATTTGAQRYQNTTFGLLWIGIPSKGMLLDSKLNRQLANECKNADQEKGILVVKPVLKPGAMPSTKVVEKVEPIVPADPGAGAAVTPAAPTTAAPAAVTPTTAAPATVAPAAPTTAAPAMVPPAAAPMAAPATVTPAAPAAPVAPANDASPAATPASEASPAAVPPPLPTMPRPTPALPPAVTPAVTTPPQPPVGEVKPN